MTARVTVGIRTAGKHRAPEIFRWLGHFGLSDLALKIVGRHTVSRGGQITILSSAVDATSQAGQLIDDDLSIAAAIDDLDAMAEVAAEFHDQPCAGCRYAAKLT